MTTNTYLLFTAWLVFFTSLSQAQNSKVDFKDEKGKFKISFPIEPEVSEQSGVTEYGEITTYSFKAESEDDDNLSYDVYYLDYPQAFTDTLSTESVYALFYGSQMTNVNSDNIQLIGTFNHNILGYIGREYRWQDIKTNKFSRVRFFMVNNRMYILIVNTEGEKNFNLSINKFFDSFKLIDTTPNPNTQTSSEGVDKIYKIKFPKETEIREMETPTEYGNAKVVVECYQPKLVNDDNLIYMVMIIKYPEDITLTDNFDLDDYYSNVIQRALNGRQTTLISKNKVSENGISGIEMKESFRDGQIVIKQKVFLKGNSQIALQVMTIPNNDDNKSMNSFFDSFEFIEE
ncbi:hypothetical protein [Flammeovirga agarivorans]|uniref:Uncharacterized protein n=1 Tax=Flammeovirga agarivorans TaxID=2726742 RepID=A0A7X8SK29_9BACT|nr:hypothetical protein [Flammeovirga agarivorans]NLR91679.1 hypothetical protein [Flammeovirga agarivorans]